MDTDRELLEMAAQAAGIEYHAYMDDPIFGTGINPGEVDVPIWNPLLDDGQALRLAVKLRLIVEAGANRTIVFHPGADESALKPIEWYEHSDTYAATRRAIVRAAAEIGKGT